MGARLGLTTILVLGSSGFLALCIPCQAADRIPLIERRPLSDLEPRYRQSVLSGWQSFHRSHADDGVACVDCHPRPVSVARWTRAYPKVEVFDGTPYRVKTLRQVVLEALDRHSDLAPCEQQGLAEDLVSFISWWGDGQLMSPGQSRALAPPSEDLAALKLSGQRGRDLFHGGSLGPCLACHDSGRDRRERAWVSLTGVAATFPRYVTKLGAVVSLDTFLQRHIVAHSAADRAPGDGQIADLAAYLARLAEGSTLCPGSRARQPKRGTNP